MPEASVAAIVGPTAVGKTEVSLAVAERLDAEIVSIDSMQIYRGMDVGTAKASPDEMARVPHHLIDLKDPSDEVTVADFRELARGVIADVQTRGKLPLLVGGSGLYFRAVVDDLVFPPRSNEVRLALEGAVDSLGPETLHAQLSEIDPAAAAKIEPGNARRTIRALEAIELTGRPFSDNDTWDNYESIYELRIAGLQRPREALYGRIEARVDAMLGAGLVAEARSLANPGRTARQALGYRQILEMPGTTEVELRTEIVRATKRFARRQESWFRADPRISWFDADHPDAVVEVLGYLAGNRSSMDGA